MLVVLISLPGGGEMFFNGGFSLKSPQAANVFGLDGGQTAPLIEPGRPSSAVALRLSVCPSVGLSVRGAPWLGSGEETVDGQALYLSQEQEGGKSNQINIPT